jgi:hypothetical protein
MDSFSDIMLDNTDDLQIVNGDFTFGESLLQEVGIIIRLHSGDLKSDPVLGPNLIQLIHTKKDEQEIEERLRLHLQRDNKSYDDVKKVLHLKLKS